VNFLPLGEEIIQIGEREGGKKIREHLNFLADVYVSSALRGLKNLISNFENDDSGLAVKMLFR